MNETIVTVVGNVASDMKMRRVGEGHDLVTGFRVASSERRWDRGSEAWVDGDRFSAWVSCWRRLGEGVVLSLTKGDPVVVTGRLSVREYEQDGQRRFATEIAAIAVGPDLSRSSAKVRRRRAGDALDAAAAESAEGGADSGAEAATEAATQTGTQVPAAVTGSGHGEGDSLDREPADDGTEVDTTGSGVLSLVS